MDLETENRIASVLLREAAELRRQAEKDGVRAYLEKPNVRHRPNSRFSQQLSLVFNNVMLFFPPFTYFRFTKVKIEKNKPLHCYSV